MSKQLPFYEFFAGGGLARLGLGDAWECLFANDISAKKGFTYQQNFAPATELLIGDVQAITPNDLPGEALLAWASFPCQDLSLAGNGAGLRADRSGTFWPFWMLMTALNEERRGPPIIVLENVVGLLSSNQGQDFRELVTVLVTSGYNVGAMIIDAVHFVPQSRPRLFFIAVKKGAPIELTYTHTKPHQEWHQKSLIKAYESLPHFLKSSWIWWNLPPVMPSRLTLHDLIEIDTPDIVWHTEAETQRLLSMMSPQNSAKVQAMRSLPGLHVGTIYKRTRTYNGVKSQRAEVRFDGVSGCLRTPAGGSSRQILLIVQGECTRSRLLSVREAARLMGVPDTYKLPTKYNDGYHVMGDAVVVPVVAWLESNLLRPLAESMEVAQFMKV